MEDNKKEQVVYEQFYARALAKLDKIDFVDLSSLIKDFESKTNEKIKGLWYRVPSIGNYVEHIEKIGVISIRKEYTLDSFLEDKGCTLKEYLIKVSGDIVNKYFDEFNIEEYYETKNKSLEDTKEKVTKNANVLLISDDERDYEGLINYGFKNIDYFKSIVRADQYFEKNPKELNKYHIILKGNQNVQRCCFGGHVPLENKIQDIKYKQLIFSSPLNRYDYSDHTEFVMYINDRKNRICNGLNVSSYNELFDKLMEDALVNNLLETAKVSKIEFKPYVDYVNPNRLSLPTKKSDLKILFLDAIRVSDYAERIAKELGLNITFKKDNNCTLGDVVKTNLGNYDIIIASDMYSSNLITMNCESTEQCKDTGRELTLLVTNNYNSWQVDEKIGKKVNIRYSYGGSLAPSKQYFNKEFRLVRELVDVEDQDCLNPIKYHKDEYYVMKAILQSAVSLYNDTLNAKNNMGLEDIDFKSADEFEEEYVQVKAEKDRELREEMIPINEFNDFTYEVSKYLENKKNGLINEELEGLIITETENGVKIDNVYQGTVLCSIIYSKNYNRNIIVFDVQTITNKGTLSNSEMVGLYTSSDEHLDNLPNRPDENQSAALASIEKKVKANIVPINEKIKNRQNSEELFSQKNENIIRKILKRIRKNK